MASPPLWRQLLSVLLLPAIVAGVVPISLHLVGAGSPLPVPAIAAIALRAVGLLLVAAGAFLAATSIRLFGEKGEGTLAPWDPTRRLVVRGPYRFVRNPMITGVASVLLGEAAVLQTSAQLAWFAGFAVANALWIPLVEERGLVRRFGDEWVEYARHVPRWIPRLRPWDPP